uniref:Uncharacterized protein n=1 Tax=Heterorhabditis bacteriophora TaxID=37862 RepID=A0A1I7WLW4_HETBA
MWTREITFTCWMQCLFQIFRLYFKWLIPFR